MTTGYRLISRVLVWVVFLFLSIGLFFIAFLATKMRLSGDDYCINAVLVQEGLWGMVIRSYFEVSTFNGNRYSQIFFIGLSGLSPIWGNGLLVVVCLIAWIVGMTYMVRWISHRLHLQLTFIECLVIAESYACMVLMSTHTLDQSVIWRSAMTAYFMPIVAFTWLLLLIIWAAEHNGLKLLHYTAIFLTALIGAGFSETGATFQGGFLGLVMLVILLFMKRKHDMKAFLIPVIISILGVLMGLALLYFSPVTEIRRSSLPEIISINELLVLLGLNIKVYLWHSIMRRIFTLVIPFVFGLSLGLINFTLQPKNKNQSYANLAWKHWSLFIVLLPIVSTFLIACVMLPGTYVQVSYPPARALILAQKVLTMACLLGGILTVLWVDSIFKLAQLKALWMQNVLRGASLVLFLSVIISPMLLINQNADKLPLYTRWSQLWDVRHEALLTAGRNNVMEIHVIQLDHVITDVGELSPDENYWYNNCAEMYYGIDRIFADQPGW